MLTEEEIENRYRYHPPSEHQQKTYEALEEQWIEMAKVIEAVAPPGRELALAHTKLQEARMWTNAAIACERPEEHVPPGATADHPDPAPGPVGGSEQA